jgi:hypothetical protein
MMQRWRVAVVRCARVGVVPFQGEGTGAKCNEDERRQQEPIWFRCFLGHSHERNEAFRGETESVRALRQQPREARRC